MNNKEALLNIMGYCWYQGNNQLYPKELYELSKKTIEKDLEILEILLKHIDTALLNRNNEAPIFMDILKSKHYSDWVTVINYLKNKEVERCKD